MSNYNKIATLETHNNVKMITALRLSNGMIACTDGDKTIKIWKEVDGFRSCKHTLEGHTYKICTIIELSDGMIASAGDDETIKIWANYDGFWSCQQTLEGHSNSVKRILELKDGRIVSGCYDGMLKIWHKVDGLWQCEQTLINDGCMVNAIAINDGQFLICGSGSSINIWEIEKPIEPIEPIEPGEKISIGLGLISELKGDTITISRNNKTIATISMKLDVSIEGNKQDE